MDLFTVYGDANRYRILEVIGKENYGVVYAAVDTHTGEKVAIKKINNVFEHISDPRRMLCEVKSLRLMSGLWLLDSRKWTHTLNDQVHNAKD
ncbi:unnamed protein product [Brassica oleracea var. botrytis]